MMEMRFCSTLSATSWKAFCNCGRALKLAAVRSDRRLFRVKGRQRHRARGRYGNRSWCGRGPRQPARYIDGSTGRAGQSHDSEDGGEAIQPRVVRGNPQKPGRDGGEISREFPSFPGIAEPFDVEKDRIGARG